MAYRRWKYATQTEQGQLDHYPCASKAATCDLARKQEAELALPRLRAT